MSLITESMAGSHLKLALWDALSIEKHRSSMRDDNSCRYFRRFPCFSNFTIKLPMALFQKDDSILTYDTQFLKYFVEVIIYSGHLSSNMSCDTILLMINCKPRRKLSNSHREGKITGCTQWTRALLKNPLLEIVIVTFEMLEIVLNNMIEFISCHLLSHHGRTAHHKYCDKFGFQAIPNIVCIFCWNISISNLLALFQLSN